MLLINVFIAFFVIVALAISWLVYNLMFGAKTQMAEVGIDESTPSADASPEETPVAVHSSATRAEVAAETPVVTAKAPAKRQPRKTTRRNGSTCREEIVAAARAVTEKNGRNEFAAKEVVEYLLKKGTGYSTGTIRSSVSSHADFERIERGRYRLAGG